MRAAAPVTPLPFQRMLMKATPEKGAGGAEPLDAEGAMGEIRCGLLNRCD